VTDSTKVKPIKIRLAGSKPKDPEPETAQVQIEPKKQEWVKSKCYTECLSADPNDCFVMCLVTIPPKYKTIITKPGEIVCEFGYELNSSEEKCIKKVETLSEKTETSGRLKAVNLLTECEIKIIDYKEIECGN